MPATAAKAASAAAAASIGVFELFLGHDLLRSFEGMGLGGAMAWRQSPHQRLFFWLVIATGLREHGQGAGDEVLGTTLEGVGDTISVLG